jgi:hypothetical protein
VQTASADLQTLLRQLAGTTAAHSSSSESEAREVAASYQLVVQCADEAEQRALFERFTAEGLSCRVLTM